MGDRAVDGTVVSDGRQVRWGDPVVNGSAPEGFVLPTGTVAFLLTDVEGSTRLWEREPDAMALAMERHGELLDAAVSAHGGVCPPAQGEGDSIVAAFARASDAVLAAMDAQRSLLAETWPTTVPLRVRMAVHAGEARTASDGNYAGQAIIRTARLRAIAHGGQVLVSQPARDLTVDHRGDQVHLLDLGEHRLRDLARPERVFQLTGAGLEADFGELRSLDTHRHNLPVQLSTFIGRVGEIGVVAGLLGSNRLVTIVGAGGAGKTRLALQVAAEVIDRSADGTFWIELADIRTVDLLVPTIAAGLGARGDVGPDAADKLASVIAAQELLLVIDNCEHVIDAIAGLVDGLLRACPGLRVLATSREPLEIAGEVAWRIPPLAVPPSGTGGLGAVAQLSQFDAVRLFLDRAQRVRPNFHLTDENAPAVAGLCQRLDGIPLALELAAARIRSLTVEQILDGLVDAFRLLTGGGRGALARQATLDASITWSHDLLTAEEQVLLRRLSVFVGGCHLDDAEAVVHGDGLEQQQVLDVLDRLVAQSLVVADDAARYRLLETVRQYAARRLEAAGETDDLRRRHAEQFLRGAMTRAPTFVQADCLENLHWVAVELDNLLATFEWLLLADRGPDLVGLALRMVVAMINVAPAAGIAVAEKAFAAVHADEAADRAATAFALGLAELLGSRPASALGHLAEAAQLSDAAKGSIVSTPAALHLVTAASYSQPKAASPMFEEVIERAQLDGEVLWRVLATGNSALVDGIYLGDLSRAEEGFARTAAIAVEGDPGSMILPWLAGWRAYAAVSGGDLPRARAFAAQSEAWLHEVGSWRPGLEPIIRTSLIGIVAFYGPAIERVWSGAPVPVAHQLPELATRAEVEGLAVAVLAFRYIAGLLALRDGRTAEAVSELTQAYEAGAAIGFTSVIGVVAGAAGLATAATGDRSGAIRWAEVTEALADAHGMIEPAGLALLLRTDLALLDGTDEVAAYEAAHAAVAHTHRHGYRLQLLEALERLARAELAVGDPVAAARVLGATAAARTALGVAFRFGVGDPADPVRAALGAAAYDEAAAAGAALDLDATVELVQRTRGARKRPTVGWASLTPTEHQVVDLVAAGLSNPQVAERLLMSRETVKTHLTHVFGKLGIGNRTELATFVARRDPG